jgi:CDK inhibitor PHO81
LGSEDRNSASSDHKTAFFFKLERELEKVCVYSRPHAQGSPGAQINTFYLRKEAEYKTRLETLLAQRRAAAMRVLPGEEDDNVQNHVEWNVVEEGFRQLERDLSKLQVSSTYGPAYPDR